MTYEGNFRAVHASIRINQIISTQQKTKTQPKLPLYEYRRISMDNAGLRNRDKETIDSFRLSGWDSK